MTHPTSPKKGRGRPRLPIPADLEPLLGVATDADLSRRFGISTPTVRKRREMRGVPSAPHPQGTTRDEAGYHPLSKDAYRERLESRHPGLLERLGRDPDTKTAAVYGLSRQRLHQIRRRLDIDRRPDRWGTRRRNQQP